MSCCIVGLRIRLIAHILHLIYPFFCLSMLNLCHKFLRYCTRKNLQTWYTYVIWVIVSWDRNSGTLLIFFYFLSSFLSFPILHVNIKNLCQSFLYLLILEICVRVFAGLVEARTFRDIAHILLFFI